MSDLDKILETLDWPENFHSDARFVKSGLKVSVACDEATLPFDIGLVLVKVDTLSIFEKVLFDLIYFYLSCYLLNKSYNFKLWDLSLLVSV